MWENHVSCYTSRQPSYPMKNVTGRFYSHSVCPVCANLLYKTFIFISLFFFICKLIYHFVIRFLYRLELFHKIMNMLYIYKFHHSKSPFELLNVYAFIIKNYTNDKGKFVIWVHLKACLDIEGSALVLLQDMYNTHKVCVWYIVGTWTFVGSYCCCWNFNRDRKGEWENFTYIWKHWYRVQWLSWFVPSFGLSSFWVLLLRVLVSVQVYTLLVFVLVLLAKECLVCWVPKHWLLMSGWHRTV